MALHTAVDCGAAVAHRSAASCSSCACIALTVVPALMRPSQEWGVFLFFAGFVVIMSIFIFFLLPETKGVPIEEM